MSGTNGLTQQYFPSTLDGLTYLDVDGLTIDGSNVDITALVPYTGSTKEVDLNSQNIKTTRVPVANPDLTNKLYVDSSITTGGTGTLAIVNLNFVRYTGSISNTDLGTYTISSSTAPASGNVLTNKTYVDTKDALRVPYTGATANVDLSTYTISSSTAPASGNVLTNKTYVDTQDALRVPYTGATANLNLNTRNLIANTAQFTAITSATPSLALGVDGSGNLNSFPVPTATNLLPLNNTWTGTNTYNNNLTTGDGYTNTFGNAVYTGVNAITSAVPTTTGITAIAPTPLPAITYSIPTYTCTPSGATTYACFWSSATFTANVRYFFSFTNATTTVYAPSATLTVCQANTANSAYVAISSAYSLPNTSTLFSGYFTPNTNASYVGQIFFILSNVKFTPFTWTAFSYGIGALTVQGNETIVGLTNIRAGNPYAVPNNYMSAGSLTIGDCSLNYGGGTTYWSSNTAGLLMECLDNTEIAVHDAGNRVSSMMRYNANTLTMGRDMGWGVANTAIAGTLDTASNITMATGTFRKNSAGSPNEWATITGGGGGYSPYMEFYAGSLRRGYIGNATASAIILAAENNCDFNLYTGGGLRMIVKNSGLTGFGRDPSYTVDINGSQRVYNGLNANDSMTYYGPNASWGAYLVVGSGTDKAGGSTAQVISTNGNLHLDGGNSNSIYYGHYANSRGTPNSHEFYGSAINFQSGLPYNTSIYSQMVCLNGASVQRTQCVSNQIYNSNSVAWGGGINITYAFYNYTTTAPVSLIGKYSGYWSSAYTAQILVRIYNQSSGVYYYYYINTFTNNGGNHVSIPLNCFVGNTGSGWNDVYIVNSSGYNTDGNDQLQITAFTMPVPAY